MDSTVSSMLLNYLSSQNIHVCLYVHTYPLRLSTSRKNNKISRGTQPVLIVMLCCHQTSLAFTLEPYSNVVEPETRLNVRVSLKPFHRNAFRKGKMRQI